jgi:hypothetical protein
VGYCGAEIAKSFICSKLSSFTPKGLETILFQNGCLAFRSPAKMDLLLKFKSSIMSSSVQALLGDLYSCKQYFTITNRYADPCRFYRNKGRYVYMVVGNAFSNCNGSSAFPFREAVCTIKVIIRNMEPLVGFEMCL